MASTVLLVMCIGVITGTVSLYVCFNGNHWSGAAQRIRFAMVLLDQN